MMRSRQSLQETPSHPHSPIDEDDGDSEPTNGFDEEDRGRTGGNGVPTSQ
jgi:hypothetical protein